jgi:hypothetical protein
LGIAVVGWATLGAQDAVRGETAGSPTGPMPATALRTANTVSLPQAELAWVGQRSDDDGNLFFIVMPTFDQRDVKKGRPSKYAVQPRDIRFVSADGRRTKVLSPAAIPAFSEDNVETLAIATNPGGTLFALVWATRGEIGRYYIVAFDKNGSYESRQEINPEEMSVGRFEVFGSGDFLLLGRHPYSKTTRIAVMSAGGSALSDVVSSATQDVEAGDTPPPFPGQHIARGGDGRIYFVPEGKEVVYFVDSSGYSQEAFKLAPMPRNRKLVDLKAAGRRLAVIYFEERPQGKGRLWIAIYHASLGELLAVYGPAYGIPVSYEYSQGQDRFTLLKDAKNLVTVVSP